MRITGDFINKAGQKVSVDILSGAAEPLLKVDGGRLAFPLEDAVTVEGMCNGTLDRIVPHQARIRLLTADYLGEIFAASPADTTVTIAVDKHAVFRGHLMPRAYSQGYADALDELELTCIDYLTALKYGNYLGIGTRAGAPDYADAKASAGMRSFRDLILEALPDDVQVSYDGSRLFDVSGHPFDTFDRLSVNTLLFFGSDESDMWSSKKIVEAILRYLNLHIVQRGDEVYIYDIESLSGDSITWTDLFDGGRRSEPVDLFTLDRSTAASADTAITIGEVYSRVQLPCSVEEVDAVVESPLDADALTSPYSGRQKYLSEIWCNCGDDSNTAFSRFVDAVRGARTPYDGGKIVDWYVQVKDHPYWRFTCYDAGVPDIVEAFCADGTKQQQVPNIIGSQDASAILSLGSVETDLSYGDNAVASRLDMTDCMVISVNGDGDSCPGENDIKRRIPIAVYDGPSGGSAYSPIDDASTNYIVFSGSIALTPLTPMSASYKHINDLYPNGVTGNWLQVAVAQGIVPVDSKDDKKGRFYTRKYWEARTPSDTPTVDTANDSGLIPFGGEGQKMYEFTRSSFVDSVDSISKVCVLACMLVIGDKCLVETVGGASIANYQWVPFKERSACRSDEEYYNQCFTLGFDPKIGDMIVGQEYPLQNNISFELGIDAEGTAIPVRRADKLSGAVRFEILGPVNLGWNDYTYRHGTWFRSAKVDMETVAIMTRVSNIVLKDFEVKLYSDNGKSDKYDSSDLIYVSDTDESYVNELTMDETEFVSQLTADEAYALGARQAPVLNTVIDTAHGTGVYVLCNPRTLEYVKPEKLTVDAVWREYHRPRVIMETEVKDQGTMWQRWHHPAMGKEFFVQNQSYMLDEGTVKLTLKEMFSND